MRLDILFSTSDGSSELCMRSRVTVVRVESELGSVSGFAATATKKFALKSVSAQIGDQRAQVGAF
jgi:hypothetical protein